MSSVQYQVIPAQEFQIFSPPVELPGQIQGRQYLQVKPSQQVVGQYFSQTSIIEFLSNNSQQFVDLPNSYLQLLLELQHSTDGTTYATAGNQTTAAPVFMPQWFRQTYLSLGSATVESTSSNQAITTYVYNLLRWSKSAALGEGELEYVKYLDVVTYPASNTAYPPAAQGSNSTIVAPVSNTIAQSNAQPYNVSSVTSAVNVGFNIGWVKRLSTVSFAGSRIVVRLPLSRFLGYCREGAPCTFGQQINMRLYPNTAGQLIQKTDATYVYDWLIRACDLFLHVLTPSAAVSANILEEIGRGVATRFQYTAMDSYNFQVPAATNSFTTSLGIPAYQLQFVVITAVPQSYQAQMLLGTANPNTNVSISPSPIASGGQTTISSAFLSYGNSVIPSLPYGNSIGDQARAYNAYLTASNAMSIAGEGPILDYGDWAQNHWLLCFDCRSREVTGVNMGTPSTSLTVNLSFAANPDSPYAVRVTYFATREAEFKASSSGVVVLNV